MAKHTVIDWQRDSVMVATANQRGSHFAIEKLSHQPIGELTDSATVKQAVAAAAQELGQAKGPAVVVVARELVEVRTISIPRMDPAELPDVIRFQAQRQLANMGENWLLDFVLLPDAPGQEMLTALVGVISPQEFSQINGACEAAGYQVTHVGLRPLEIARYAVQSQNLPSSGASILISVSGTNADLIVLKDGRVVQIRSTKLPSDSAQAVSAMQGEVRRSLMAASGQLGQESPKSVMLFASEQSAASMQAAIAEAASATVTVVEPSSLITDVSASPELIENGGLRLAALAGASALPTAAKENTIDFRSPKKRPPKKNHRQTYLLAAAAGITLVCGFLTWWRMASQGLADQLASLQKQETKAEEDMKTYQQISKETDEVEAFLSSSPNWLDELTYLSKKIPTSDKVQVSGTSFTTTNTGQSQIRISRVLADSDTTLRDFEQSIRDDNHDVASANRQKLAEPQGSYRWAESPVLITLNGRGWDLLDEKKKPAKGKTPEAAKPAAEAKAEQQEADTSSPSDQNPTEDVIEASDEEAAIDDDKADGDASTEAADKPEADDKIT